MTLAFILLIRDSWTLVRHCLRDVWLFRLYPEKLSEIEKAQQVRCWAFGYRIFRFFIVATALTPDELLQRLHYYGERNDKQA